MQTVLWDKIKEWSEVKAEVVKAATADPHNTERRNEIAKEVAARWDGGFAAVIGIYTEIVAKLEAEEPKPKPNPWLRPFGPPKPKQKIEGKLEPPKPEVAPSVSGIAKPKAGDAGQFEAALAKPKVEFAPPSDWATLKIPRHATELETLTYVPGVVGNITEWIVSNSRRPNRMMALGAALCVVGTVIGRRIKGPTDSATHLYVVMLAPTGCGKDDPLQSGPKLMDAIGAPESLGPGELASSPGFIKRLIHNPLMVCFIDELGDELEKINNQNGNVFVTNLSGTLKKCYNAFGFVMTAAKAHEESVRIDWPAPSIVGAATPERFFGALKPGDFESGFANRFLILPFEGFRRPPERLVRHEPPPKELVKALQSLPRQEYKILNQPPQGAGRPTLEAVGWGGHDAEEIYLSFSRKMDSLEDGAQRRYELGMRAAENAVRAATIVAVGRGLRVVEHDDIAWAIKLSEQSFEAAAGGAERYAREFLEFPKYCDLVAEAYCKDGFISSRDAHRRFGRNQRWGNELGRVLAQLMKEERIRAAKRFPSGQESFGHEWVGDEEQSGVDEREKGLRGL